MNAIFGRFSKDISKMKHARGSNSFTSPLFGNEGDRFARTGEDVKGPGFVRPWGWVERPIFGVAAELKDLIGGGGCYKK